MERRKGKEESWTGWRKVNGKRKKNLGTIDIDGKKKLMTVLFVQHTPKSELAKRIRERLESLEKLGDLKFKVVEKTGSKLEEILHKSDAWSNRNCERKDCLLCLSAAENEKKGMCRKKNVVYETFCITCYDEKKMRKEESELYEISCKDVNDKMAGAVEETGKRKRNEEREKPEGMKKRKDEDEKFKKEYTVKYVGETGRSAYERGAEHLSDFLNYEEGSHLLKHYLACHRNLKMSDVKFGMKVRNCFKSAIERQIGEAVAIDVEKRKGVQLMNSKSEYNRCHIPRITTKSMKEIFDENEKEVEDEKRVKSEIKMMKKLKGKKREKEEKENLKNEKDEKDGKTTDDENENATMKRRKIEEEISEKDENEKDEKDEDKVESRVEIEVKYDENDEMIGGKHEKNNENTKKGIVSEANTPPLVMMGLGSDWLAEGPGPGVKLMGEVEADTEKIEIDEKNEKNNDESGVKDKDEKNDETQNNGKVEMMKETVFPLPEPKTSEQPPKKSKNGPKIGLYENLGKNGGKNIEKESTELIPPASN